jgi:ADP-ribose diphosphatase
MVVPNRPREVPMAEQTLASEMAYTGRLISLRVDDVLLANGHHARREIVEHPGAVVILAWDGERLAVVRQWRQAAGMTLLEVPAGTRDAGEEPAASARRELAEEVGVIAATWQSGPSFFSAPGFCTERLSLFLATDLSKTNDVASPEDEDLEASWLSLPEALAAVDDGRIQDAKSLVAIFWLARHRGRLTES